jgi:hypothetical protein
LLAAALMSVAGCTAAFQRRVYVPVVHAHFAGLGAEAIASA